MGHQYYTTLLATFFHIALTTNRDAKELPLLLGFLTNRLSLNGYCFSYSIPNGSPRPEGSLVRNTNEGAELINIIRACQPVRPVFVANKKCHGYTNKEINKLLFVTDFFGPFKMTKPQ